MFNCMVTTMVIFYLLEELVDLLLAGDLFAGITVDSIGVSVIRWLWTRMDWGLFGVNFCGVGEGFTPLVMEGFNAVVFMVVFIRLDLGSLREGEGEGFVLLVGCLGQVVEGFRG